MTEHMTPAARASPRKRVLPERVSAAPSLDSLQKIEDFQAANAHVFGSVPSLRWFYRQHREELLARNAVVSLAGRLLINAPVFAEMAISIGARVAAKRAEDDNT